MMKKDYQLFYTLEDLCNYYLTTEFQRDHYDYFSNNLTIDL
jgi:hypothetical protein